MAPTELGRISERAIFDGLRRATGRAARGPVRVRHIAPRSLEDQARARVGYAMGRSFGPAVKRNRGRRRLRAAIAGLAPEIPPGCYLVSADPSVTEVGYDQLVAAVKGAMTAAARGTARSGPEPASGPRAAR